MRTCVHKLAYTHACKCAGACNVASICAHVPVRIHTRLGAHVRTHACERSSVACLFHTRTHLPTSTPPPVQSPPVGHARVYTRTSIRVATPAAAAAFAGGGECRRDLGVSGARKFPCVKGVRWVEWKGGRSTEFLSFLQLSHSNF